MKIVQTPQNANEFRYLQFAWKAVDPNVTGITLEYRESHQPAAIGMAGLYCGASVAAM